jgi:nicotinate-nucleotide adenylyltransferase
MNVTNTKKMRIGLYGGGFDPIHFGHLILMQTAIETLDLEKVIVMPSGGVAHYKVDPTFTPGSARYDMACLATESNPRLEVDSFEVDQGRFVYTINTLRHLQGKYSGIAEIILLVGGDWKDKIPTWKNGEQLIKEFPIAVFSRPGFEHTTDLTLPSSGEQIVYVNMPLIDISSSMIRERVRASLSIEYYAPEPVRRYIEGKHLYR